LPFGLLVLFKREEEGKRVEGREKKKKEMQRRISHRWHKVPTLDRYFVGALLLPCFGFFPAREGGRGKIGVE